jgi:hypothetical protein
VDTNTQSPVIQYKDVDYEKDYGLKDLKGESMDALLIKI